MVTPDKESSMNTCGRERVKADMQQRIADGKGSINKNSLIKRARKKAPNWKNILRKRARKRVPKRDAEHKDGAAGNLTQLHRYI